MRELTFKERIIMSNCFTYILSRIRDFNEEFEEDFTEDEIEDIKRKICREYSDVTFGV